MMHLSEKRYLAIYATITLVIGVIAFYAATSFTPASGGAGDKAWIQVYIALLGEDGKLVERYTYQVSKEGLHMLYRKWRDPLLGPGEQYPKPYIEHLETICPPGFIPYLYTHDKRLYLPPAGEQYRERIKGFLEDARTQSETGCFNPRGIKPGAYTITYVFRLHPPLICNDHNCLLDLSLASPDHLYYHVYAIGINTANATLALLPEDLDAKIIHMDGMVKVVGRSLDEYSGLRILLITQTPFPSTGFITRGDPLKTYQQILSDARQKRGIIRALTLVGGAWALLAAPILIALYLKYGVERKPEAPIPTGFPPETGEKPWQVNLLYTGDVGRLTRGAVIATILDLAARGIITINPSPQGKTTITLPDEENEKQLDPYEKKVVEALKILSEDGKTVHLDRISKIMREKRGLIRTHADSLFDPTPFKNYYKNAVETGRKPLIVLLVATLLAAITAIATAWQLELDSQKPAITLTAVWILAVMAYIPPLLMPSYVIGRWRQGYLEKYLAWRQFLEEIGRQWISQGPVPPTRIAAYLVALGEEKLAEKSLRRLGELYLAYYNAARSLGNRYWRSTSRGGGGGGGGGFGGGGAGAR